ncbi:MAG TPA: hypothetical protein VK638_23505 [Edaphobacter sp.]|nr:hypothetical protein [Edaphobacter sp.]
MNRTSLYRAIARMIRDGWIEVTTGTDARCRSAKATRKGEIPPLASSRYEDRDNYMTTVGRQKWDEHRQTAVKRAFGTSRSTNLSSFDRSVIPF